MRSLVRSEMPEIEPDGRTGKPFKAGRPFDGLRSIALLALKQRGDHGP